MDLDLETIGYFLYMEEQEKENNRSGDTQEQKEKEGYNNGWVLSRLRE